MMTYAVVGLLGALYVISVAVNSATDVQEKAREIQEKEANKN